MPISVGVSTGFPVELRKIVYTTNAIESLNARYRKPSDTEAPRRLRPVPARVDVS